MAHDTDRKGGATVTADSIPAGNGSATADGAPAKGGGPVTGHPVLQVDRLRVTVHHKEILRGVDLTLHEGEWLGVIGPNGAGKSTLLGAMAGVRRFTGGLTLASGRPPRARDISLMPQTPLLPPGMTVAEYILMGRTAHLRWLAQESQKDRDIVAQVIRRLSLADFADRIVTDLSGGEAQRVVVARALAQQAPILLLDEPTSALDIGHQASVLDLVDELRRQDGLTVVAAMHDLGTAAYFSNRLLLLHQGRVAAMGPPREVLDPATLSRVYGAELEVHDVGGRLVILPVHATRTDPRDAEPVGAAPPDLAEGA